jgi:4-hydroxy-tetrahydrodipicolinate synthase
MHELCMAAVSGDAATAMRLQFELMPLHKALFVEANPIPVKWAAARMGLCLDAIRLPMTVLSEASQSTVRAAMRATGLLKD